MTTETAAQLDPKNADIFINMGINYLKMGSDKGGEAVQESYVNVVPTPQGGTHVNGLRTGLTEAMREFCEFRNLLPRGVKLSPEDVWDKISFILHLKM